MTDPSIWANESFQIVRTYVYNYNSTDLGDQYFKENWPIVKLRVTAAGVRLAQTLMNIYN
jgi:hypothetical protein